MGALGRPLILQRVVHRKILPGGSHTELRYFFHLQFDESIPLVLENTPPRVRTRDPCPELPAPFAVATFGTSLSSSGGRSYRFCPTDPRIDLFCTPSSPPSSAQRNTGTGFDRGSGKRASIRRALSRSNVRNADRSRTVFSPSASITGARSPEPDVCTSWCGLAIAFSALACLMIPPM